MAFFSFNHDIIEAIYRSEINASRSITVSDGESTGKKDIVVGTSLLLEEYGKRYIKKGGSKRKAGAVLTSLSRKIQEGVPRYSAYKGILDKDILSLLQLSADAHPSEIFKKYVPAKRLAESILNRIRKSLLVPMLMYPIVVFGLSETLISIIREMQQDKFLKMGSLGNFILDNFLLTSFIWWGIFLVFFLIFPKNTPIIRNIFRKVRDLLVVSSISVLRKVKVPSDIIAKSLSKQFSFKHSPGIGITGVYVITDLLEREGVINTLQSAEIEIGADFAHIESSLNLIVEELTEDVSLLRITIDKVVGGVSLVMLLLPMMQSVYLYLGMLNSLSSALVKAA